MTRYTCATRCLRFWYRIFRSIALGTVQNWIPWHWSHVGEGNTLSACAAVHFFISVQFYIYSLLHTRTNKCAFLPFVPLRKARSIMTFLLLFQQAKKFVISLIAIKITIAYGYAIAYLFVCLFVNFKWNKNNYNRSKSWDQNDNKQTFNLSLSKLFHWIGFGFSILFARDTTR